jgi:hypothetical protein
VRIPDWLALVGDAVDDLPGVPGFGPKSAAAALAAFGELEAFPADPARWAAAGLRGAARLAESFAAHRARALECAGWPPWCATFPRSRRRSTSWPGAERAAAAFDALCDRLGWGRIATRVPRWRAGV